MIRCCPQILIWRSTDTSININEYKNSYIYEGTRIYYTIYSLVKVLLCLDRSINEKYYFLCNTVTLLANVCPVNDLPWWSLIA